MLRFDFVYLALVALGGLDLGRSWDLEPHACAQSVASARFHDMPDTVVSRRNDRASARHVHLGHALVMNCAGAACFDPILQVCGFGPFYARTVRRRIETADWTLVANCAGDSAHLGLPFAIASIGIAIGAIATAVEVCPVRCRKAEPVLKVSHECGDPVNITGHHVKAIQPAILSENHSHAVT